MTKASIRDSMNTILTIASKDILDALKNRVVISMIIMLSIILLVPKMLPMIFEQPQTILPVYDLSDSPLIAKLNNTPGISVQNLHSEQELASALCGSVFPEVGLQIPPDFNEAFPAGEHIEFQGYVCWGKRHQVSELLPKLEGMLTQSLGQPVVIRVDGNILYPPAQGGLLFSMATINSVLMILVMGVFLVPSLLFDEKETGTLQALLVSPASIGQVVTGKALAGLFYILVTGGMIFAISWADVIHWDMALVFVLSGGIFSVAVGLVIGGFYEKQQDAVGVVTTLLLFLIGSIVIQVFGMELPAWVESILSWVPSVALANLCHAMYTVSIPGTRVLTDLGIVISVSLLLYALVVWKVRRSDR